VGSWRSRQDEEGGGSDPDAEEGEEEDEDDDKESAEEYSFFSVSSFPRVPEANWGFSEPVLFS
jgi:hypothetical protein